MRYNWYCNIADKSKVFSLLKAHQLGKGLCPIIVAGRRLNPGVGGGHSHMLLGINCLSLDQLFYTNPTPNDHFFLQSTLNDPFVQFCKEFHIEMKKNFRASCAIRKLYNFMSIWAKKMQILAWKFYFHTLKDPIFWSPHRMTPLFLTKSYTESPLFSYSGRHMYVTFIFKCPPPHSWSSKGTPQSRGPQCEHAHWTRYSWSSKGTPQSRGPQCEHAHFIWNILWCT